MFILLNECFTTFQQMFWDSVHIQAHSAGFVEQKIKI
jgi:hypothetical protein